MLDNNKQFKALSINLYKLLSDKFNIKKGEFSINNFNNVAYTLGNRLKKISFDETNKILNISRTLNAVSEGYRVTDKELDELTELYAHFKKVNINRTTTLSRLEVQFRKLSMQSRDAIINENEFNEFKEYMHVRRPIEDEFEKILFDEIIPNKKNILFVVGNVGDGKSHIISYMMNKYHKSFDTYDIKIHNDATETDSPTSTAIDSMKRVLLPFSDSQINIGECRLIVAINLGILTNLITELNKEGGFTQLIEYLEGTDILSSRKLIKTRELPFNIISFIEQRNFELINGEVESEFYQQIIKKIYNKNVDNPFYKAYLEDMDDGMNQLLHVNYEYLLRTDFQQTIIYLLARAEIEHKIIISARMLFNFFYDITMPRDNNSSFNSYLPFLLFENTNKSELLTIINLLDPIRKQTRKVDEISIEMYHAANTLDKVSDLLGSESNTFYGVFQSFKDKEQDFNNFINTYLRVKYLIDIHDELFDNQLFKEYLKHYSEIDNQGQAISLFELVNESFSKWNGDSGIPGYIIKNPGKGRIKILVEIDLVPIKNAISGAGIILSFQVNDKLQEVEIDYRTFEILHKLNNGYFLKEEDKQIAITFDLFVNKVVNSMKVMNKNIILDVETKERYELKKFMSKITLSKGIV